MKIIKNWSIKKDSDNIFAKVELKNFCKHNNIEKIDFYLFALMELTTNLLKYAGGGNIWLVILDNNYCLASVDNGCGIADLEQAKMKGFTTANNSLGLGLFQLEQNESFDIEIFTITTTEESGTVVFIQPKKINKDIIFLSKSYMDLEYNGDYYISKGRFTLFGDVSGHGRKAQKSASQIKDFFINNFISCHNIDSFLNDLHCYIKQNRQRSSVLCLLEINKSNIQLCGVGNLGLWIQEQKSYSYHSFKDGIIGEAFHSSDKKEIELDMDKKLILTTDGFEPKRTKKFLDKLPKNFSSSMIAVCLLHFASNDMDDTSILILQHKGKQYE
jgi:anti-sigma regulatory factor (Ser/Thr protein kinase)